MDFIEANDGMLSQSVRLTMDFGFNWKFFRGDMADTQEIGFDDSAWQGVDLPHDGA